MREISRLDLASPRVYPYPTTELSSVDCGIWLTGGMGSESEGGMPSVFPLVLIGLNLVRNICINIVAASKYLTILICLSVPRVEDRISCDCVVCTLGTRISKSLEDRCEL